VSDGLSRRDVCVLVNAELIWVSYISRSVRTAM